MGATRTEPLCARIKGLGWCVQHHFSRDTDAHLWPTEGGVRPLPGYVLDGAVEIGFATRQAQKTFTEASPLLFSDEQNVFGETVAYDLTSGSRTHADRLPDPTPNGPERNDHLHVHFSGTADGSNALYSWLGELAAALAAADGALKVRTHAPRPYDNADPAPEVRHDVVPERLVLAILEVVFDDALARRRAFGAEPVRTVIERQNMVASHATAFAVSGVFTFVRDEALTLAGIRGSRVAELITDLAASNQTEREIADLFTATT